jgi:hypothetical protein
MGNFLYPNTISITRPNQNTGVGTVGYGGLSPMDESSIASGIPANIQIDKGSRTPVAKLPGDATYESIWKIIFKGPNGLTQTRDIITDELGRRFQVVSADWGPMVTTCRSQLLEV